MPFLRLFPQATAPGNSRHFPAVQSVCGGRLNAPLEMCYNTQPEEGFQLPISRIKQGERR